MMSSKRPKETLQRLIFDWRAFWTKRRIIVSLSGLLVLFAVGWELVGDGSRSAIGQGSQDAQGAEEILGQPVEVVKNYDGDTITVHIPDHKPYRERVRLIGIDTPEKNQGQWGRKATLYTRYTLKDRNVYLEPDVQERDKYGRLLAYVWVERDDGRLAMLNELLVREGLATILTIPPNVKYTDRFKAAERAARENESGFWAEGGLKMSPGEYRKMN
jgi:micrococcal nuclease